MFVSMCVYMCVYVCVYVYMYVYIYIYMYPICFISSDATLLDLHVTRNVMRSRSFTSMAPTTWNMLPYRLRRLKSPHVFANSLKDYLNLNLK